MAPHMKVCRQRTIMTMHKPSLMSIAYSPTQDQESRVNRTTTSSHGAANGNARGLLMDSLAYREKTFRIYSGRGLRLRTLDQTTAALATRLSWGTVGWEV
jgi:hypothetical protein